MNDKSRRRWFSFSLRTMFIIVTAACCWLGWESSVVRQRQGLLRELRTNPTFQVTTADEWRVYFPNGLLARGAIRTIPFYRKWLGDQAIQEISYTVGYRDPSEDDLRRIARVFPEAQINRRELALEPCHPGCFPRGTLVETPRGPRLIEDMREGDPILIVSLAGEPLSSLPQVGAVQTVFVTTNRLWEVETSAGMLLTTQTQPLCLASGGTRPAGKLATGDEILRWENGNVQSVEVLSVTPTDRLEKVFNLILGDSEIFIAGHFLARSKPPAQIAAK